jgi:hypothetical protein
LWREYLDEETTFADEPEYLLLGTGVIVSVEGVSLEGAALRPLHFQDIHPDRVHDVGRPLGFFLVTDTTLRLWPTPDSEYRFITQAILKPSKTARGVEDFLFESYADDIINGALHRLRKIPDKEWSNLSLAEINRLSYERGIAKARVRDYRNIPLRVKPVSFV